MIPMSETKRIFTKNKYNKTHIVFAALVFLSGCASVAKNWENAKNTNTQWSYEDFLRKHPDSKYSNEARDILKSKKEDKRKFCKNMHKITRGMSKKEVMKTLEGDMSSNSTREVFSTHKASADSDDLSPKNKSDCVPTSNYRREIGNKYGVFVFSGCDELYSWSFRMSCP